MEVVVHSTLNSIQGRVVVATDPNQPVDSLITAFCVEKGTPHRKQYVLHNKDLEVLSNSKKLAAAGVQNGDILYLGVRDGTDDWGCGCNQWWLLASVALLIGCTGLIAITILHVQQEQVLYEYGAVIDAGSSHSQVYVYKWPGGKFNGTAVPQQIYSERIVPGISNYTNDPSGAGKSLERDLAQAANIIPDKDLAGTGIYLGATAGMRLLNSSDPQVSEAIMNSTRSVIANYGFEFSDPESQARILDGREEGAYSWVTANFALGVFGKTSTSSLSRVFKRSVNPSTKGALDLGGASAQMTFVPESAGEPNNSDHENLVMYGHSYNVYTHSYLCYGLNEGFRQYLAHIVMTQNYSSIIEDPCRPSGNNQTFSYAEIFDVPCTKNKSDSSNKTQIFTMVGTSDLKECTLAVKGIFDFSTPCNEEPCSFDGVSQPPPYGEFLAFSGFYYTMSYLKLTESGKKFSLKQFEDAYTSLCAQNASTISQMPVQDKTSLGPECFKAVYIHTLLIDGYNFNATSWNSLSFILTVNDKDLGWAMGYMLNASNAIPVYEPEQRISTVLFSLLVILFGVFLAIAVGFACHARNSQRLDSEYQRMATYGSI